MDLWMLHQSHEAERAQAQRELQIRCELTDGRCWRRRIALRCGLLLLRAGRRLIAYGRAHASPSVPAPPLF